MTLDQAIGGDVGLSTHRKIARLEGRSGYIPTQYCCVCGLAGNRNFIPCSADDECVNVCHVSCAGEVSTFCCSDVSALRAAKGFAGAVKYVLNDINKAAEDSKEEEEEPLLLLSKEDLIQKIRDQTAEINGYQSAVKRYRELMTQFAAKRDAINNVLTFLDEISAAVDNIQITSTSVRSVKTTAIPEGIDRDWEVLIESCPTTSDWWKSDRPKRLKKACQTSMDQSRVQKDNQTNKQGNPTQDQRQNTRTSEQRARPRQTDQRTVAPPTRSSPPQSQRNPQKRISGGPNGQRQSDRGSKPGSCATCGKRGHNSDRCYRNLLCAHCHKKGHSEEGCRDKRDSERFEQLAKSIAAQNSSLVQAFQAKLSSFPLQQPLQQPHIFGHPLVYRTPFQPNYTGNSFPTPGFHPVGTA